MKNTLKSLIESSNIPTSVIRSVVKNMGGWEEFQQSAQYVNNHGANAGFGKFIYYKDTCAFFKRNKKGIMEMAEEQAKDFGQGMLEMISGFNCFRGDGLTIDEIAKALYQGRGEMVDQIQNAMAWYALEEVCRAYCDMLERYA